MAPTRDNVFLLAYLHLLISSAQTSSSAIHESSSLRRRRRGSRMLREIRRLEVEEACQRRKKRNITAMVISLLYASSRIVDVDTAVMTTYHTWWEERAFPHFSDREWTRNFRMSRASFDLLCTSLREELSELIPTNIRKPIPLEKRVAVALWRLATPCEFRTIGHLFGIGRSTACKIVHEVVAAIISGVYPNYVKWPTDENLRAVLRGFEVYRGMPQCAGAIDGTQIHVTPPSEFQADYLNRKGFHSINLQAVCDHRLRFTDIYVGWAGRAHDARVLRNSSLFQRGEANTLFPLLTKDIEGCNVPAYIVGDPAYPLLQWLMKGYPDTGNLTRQQRTFNYKLSSARIIIECAFGQLKGRWRCLGKKNESNIQFIPHLVSACCALHNFCIEHGDLFNSRYLDLPRAFADFEDPVEHLPLNIADPWNPEDADILLPTPSDMRQALTAHLSRR
ncbi:uncharacterized protein [Diadema antillarum]|uniref:uncharacterized protein n=1 Tax=Diadema antillarum TaxID=105358 RepID=UPI003A85932A